MKRGFMDVVATSIIPAYPGKPARWYAEEYLRLCDDMDEDLSPAKYPVESLANTLSKQVLTGKEPRIRRERIGGLYRYFPALETTKSSTVESVVIQISLSSEELEDIDNLVAVGKFPKRSDAIKWLVTEGIKGNRTYLNKAAEIKRQIEQLKSNM